MTTKRHLPPFFLLASAGLIPGITRFRKFGYNQDIDTATVPEDVISWGGELVIQTTASTISVVSTSTSDAAGLTGTSTVTINGLDVNYNEISENLTVTGITPAITTKQYLYITNAFGISSGSNYRNVGDINFTRTDNSNQMAQIPALQGRTQQCWGAVPANKKFFVDTVTATVGGKGSSVVAEVHFEYIIHGTDTWQLLLPVEVDGAPFSNKTGHKDYVVLPEKTLFRAHVEFVSANNVSVTANVAGYLVEDSVFTY